MRVSVTERQGSSQSSSAERRSDAEMVTAADGDRRRSKQSVCFSSFHKAYGRVETSRQQNAIEGRVQRRVREHGREMVQNVLRHPMQQRQRVRRT